MPKIDWNRLANHLLLLLATKVVNCAWPFIEPHLIKLLHLVLC